MNPIPHTSGNTIGDLVRSGIYGEFGRFIFTYMTPDHWNSPLSAYGYEKTGFAQGLARMRELSESGQTLHFQIYSSEERLSSWDRDTVWLEYFPAPQPAPGQPYVLILPGGGFNRQWGFIEGQAVAARANALGYPAFVLYYRVKQEPLMPLPIHDLYRAVRFIGENAVRFQVDPARYMLGGFSAGASIAGCVLTERFGWEAGGIPRPSAVFLGYAPVRFDEFYRAWRDAPEGSPAKESGAAVLRRVGGPAFSMETLSVYDIPAQLNPDAPPVFITANRDDPVVPVVNSLALIDALERRGISRRVRIGRRGGHSYGLGNGLEVAGWFDEALSLFAEQTESSY